MQLVTSWWWIIKMLRWWLRNDRRKTFDSSRAIFIPVFQTPTYPLPFLLSLDLGISDSLNFNFSTTQRNFTSTKASISSFNFKSGTLSFSFKYTHFYLLMYGTRLYYYIQFRRVKKLHTWHGWVVARSLNSQVSFGDKLWNRCRFLSYWSGLP